MEKSKLYLITGFLGAGKTTLLKKLIAQMNDKRLAVVVNEFGKEGVDGELLKTLGVALEEINNGSIFCSCRLDQFETALEALTVKEAPEVILVEASGLSDPSNVEKILNQPGKFEAITYVGSLCLVDAVNFERVVHTARVCKKQIGISRTVLINKTDLADEAHLEAIEEQIRQWYPGAVIHRTTYGAVEPAWIEEMGKEGNPTPVFQTKDIGLQKKLIRIRPEMKVEQLRKFLEQFLEDTYRVKGFVRCQGEAYLVDCVGERLSVEPYALHGGEPVNQVVALAGPGMPLTRSLNTAAEWYREFIESVE